MKILFIAPRYHTNMHFYVKALKDTGHEVKFLSMFEGGSERYDVLKPDVLGTSFVYGYILKLLKLFVNNEPKYNYWRQIFMFAPMFSISKRVMTFKPDVVLVKGFPGLFMLQALFASNGQKIGRDLYAMIQTSKHYGNTIPRKMWLFVLKHIFAVKKIITPLKNELEKSDDFFKYVPFVIEVKDFDKKYFDKNRVNIISIAKFVKRKDYLTLLKAINVLKNKYNIFLNIIGEEVDNTVLESIREYINQNKLSEMVNIGLNVAHDDVLDIYKENDLFVLPSYNEPAAYSVLEAMAAKLPVICSDTCGTRCYIEDGKNGFVFKSRNVDDLTDRIETLISSREKIKEMGAMSFEKAVKNHFLYLFSDVIK